MDKEMMAKVNEVMKANGKRELSLAELDQVVGGASGAWINSQFVSEGTLHVIA